MAITNVTPALPPSQSLTDRALFRGPNEIVVQNTAQGLIATFYGPKAQEIIDLFGTNVLPLPYRGMGRIDECLATLRRNWPGFNVSVV